MFWSPPTQNLFNFIFFFYLLSNEKKKSCNYMLTIETTIFILPAMMIITAAASPRVTITADQMVLMGIFTAFNPYEY